MLALLVILWPVGGFLSDETFFEVERASCDSVLQFTRESGHYLLAPVIEDVSRYEELAQPLADTNIHVHRITSFLATQSASVSRLISDLTALVMAAPDCWSLSARKALASAVVQFGEVYKSSVTVVEWHGLMFNVLGETLEKDVPHYAKDVMFGSLVADQLLHVVRSLLNALDYAATQSSASSSASASANASSSGLSPHARVHSYHHNAGMFDSLEALKRTTFNSWVLDKGLAAGVLREVTRGLDAASVSIGDFGAGGGHYSRWFNETGLVEFAYAFDGTPDIEEITGGSVTYLDLSKPQNLTRQFDWVFSIEVAEHVPGEFETVLVDNWARHARLGIIFSWSARAEQGIGHVNPQSEQRTIDFVSSRTGFRFDKLATDRLRAKCSKDYIADTVAVFRRP